jgi:hypothetical protein
MLGWGKKNDAKPAAPAATPVSLEPVAVPAQADHTSGPAATGAPSLPNLLLAEGRKSPRAQLQAGDGEADCRPGAFIGEILIADGVLDQDSLISFLAKHCKIPHLSLLDYLIDKSKSWKILPARPLSEATASCRSIKLGKNLTVAMVNPLDTEALEQVRTYCPDLRIKPILCASTHFEIVVKRLFAYRRQGSTTHVALGVQPRAQDAGASKPSAPAPTKLPPPPRRGRPHRRGCGPRSRPRQSLCP